MKLYHDPLSPAARTVTFFLHDQRIPFEEEIVELAAGAQFAETFGRLNPNRQVPVLEDDGFVLTESAAILKYLGDKHGRAYPADLQGRARVNEAMDWFVTHFHVFFGVLTVYPRILPKLAVFGGEALASVGRAGTRKYLDVLEARLGDRRPFVCGGEVTIADHCGLAYAALGEAVGFDYGSWPQVARWIARLKERPGYEPAYGAWERRLGIRPAAA